MKKIQLLTSIILALLMIIVPQSIALAADDSSQASAVSLISDGFSVDKKAIYAGDTFIPLHFQKVQAHSLARTFM